MSGFVGQVGCESLENLHSLLHEALKADIVIINSHFGSDLGI